MRRDWLKFPSRAVVIERLRSFFVLAGPLALFFAILTSVGPYLQYFSYWALEGDQALTYDEAMHSSKQAYLPGLAEWTTEFLDWRYLLIGLVAAIIATRAKLPRQIVIFGAVSLVPLLCLNDLLELITAGLFTTEAFVRSLLANIVGAALAGVASAIALWCFERILQSLPNLRVGRILGSLSIPLSGVFWSIVVYYLLIFFLQPTDEEFDFVLQSPMRGFVVPHEQTQKSSNDDEGETTRSFNFLPDEVIEASAKVITSDGIMRGNWRGLTEGLPFKAEIFLSADCINLSDAKAQAKSPIFTADSVNHLAFSTSTTEAELEIAGGKARAFELAQEQPTLFWLEPDKAGKHVKITNFAGPKNLLALKANGKLEAFVQFPMIDHEKSKIKRVGGYVDVSVNGKRSRYNFAPPSPFDLKKRTRCRSVAPASGQQSVPGSERILIGGVFIRLTPVEPVELVYSPFDQELSVDGSKGWAAVDGIAAESLVGEIGTTDSLSIAGQGGRLTFAEKTSSFDDDTSFSIVGHVEASLTPSLDGRFAGRARFFWMNDHLLNRTQWERLSTEWQIISLGWLGSMILLLLKLLQPVMARFRKNDPLPL